MAVGDANWAIVILFGFIIGGAAIKMIEALRSGRNR